MFSIAPVEVSDDVDAASATKHLLGRVRSDEASTAGDQHAQPSKRSSGSQRPASTGTSTGRLRYSGGVEATEMARGSEGLTLPHGELIRCPRCGERVAADAAPALAGGPRSLRCLGCGDRFRVIGGTPRMVVGIDQDSPADAESRKATADSFAYEWEQFGGLREQWRRNFLEYMQPMAEADFDGILVLDVGTGSGRHSREAARLGARVVAVDAGEAIDIARANLPSDVLTIQADAESLPLAEKSFDLVMSIGVLHHLPDPARALAGLVRFVKPGGRVHVYLYWVPDVAWHRAILRVVTAVRRVTVRLPHRLLHALCYPLAAVLWAGVVMPSKALDSHPRSRRLLRLLPLQTYMNYPFAVLVNDQFDRFSAPLERRFTKPEVELMMRRVGLVNVVVTPNYGWVAHGRVPDERRPAITDAESSKKGR
jgi:ubiquinone/menaquinone biosynthesis C-methylase UbiE